MSNVAVDGMATYGTGHSTAVSNALLAGVYAQIGGGLDTPAECEITSLPWDLLDTRKWLHGVAGASNGTAYNVRRVLPAALTTIIASFHVGLAQLPDTGTITKLFDLRNGANLVRVELWVTSTGALQWKPDSGTAVVTTGPVLVAEKVQHIEFLANRASKHVELYVDGTKVMDFTSDTGTTDTVAQVGVGSSNQGFGGLSRCYDYITDLIIRDTAGGINDGITGDRNVATLFPAADDPDNDGWSVHPLRCFGNGILDLTPANSGVYGPGSVGSVGSGDFCIEGMFRLHAQPTGSNMAVLFSKWDTTSNQRSYQLYLGGPSLDEGWLVFRTSTNGQAGTIVEKLVWPWAPELGTYYHIAVDRDAGVLRLFIDGVQAGIDVADVDTYFPSSARPSIGVQMLTTNAVANTHFDGWQDEFRLTIGASRYNANFTPPTENFPTGGDDPLWANVAWLSDWDDGAVEDDGPGGITLSVVNSAVTLQPQDGFYGYQTINKPTPSENTFIQAALVAASGILTLTTLPTNTQTVTLATKNGATPAVYTFKTVLALAFDVLIGVTQDDCVDNLIAAINHDAGEGTLYGTGTTANNDVEAAFLPTGQMLATALVPGAAGNALASVTTVTGATWTDTTLDGGQDIPDPSAFYFQRLPAAATVVDSVTFAVRQYKTDAGTAKTLVKMVGPSAGELSGTEYNVGGTPAVHFDTFEEDPDTTDPLTPQSIRTMRMLIDRTV